MARAPQPITVKKQRVEVCLENVLKESNNYRDEFRSLEHEALWSLPRILLFLCIVVALCSGAAYIFGWFGETAKVAQDQFGPSALLAKYEWFKDASAQLDKKQADISVYDGRFTHLESAYAGVPRTQWARDDREQMSTWQSEAAGAKASYNQLAADYNAQMSKFNYRFTNVGDLPKGAEKPLPREYKPYITE